MENGRYVSPSEENLDKHRYETYKYFNSLSESVIDLGDPVLTKSKNQIVICLIGPDKHTLSGQSAEFETCMRIFKAQSLIKKSDFMFYEISALVGYPNAAYFSSLFKKRTGYLPSEYKLGLCKDSASPSQQTEP